MSGFQDDRYAHAVCRWIEATFDHPAGSVKDPHLHYWPATPGYSEYTPPEPEEFELTYRLVNVDPVIDGNHAARHLDAELVVKLVTEVGRFLA